jgi:hypothetical protein
VGVLNGNSYQFRSKPALPLGLSAAPSPAIGLYWQALCSGFTDPANCAPFPHPGA